MKDKKNIILLSICIVVALGLIGYGIFGGKDKNPEDNYITRAQVAKDVALVFHSVTECQEKDNTHFSNNSDAWYVPYMNVLYDDGYISERDIMPNESDVMDSFTYGDMDKLFTNIGVVDKELLSFVKNNKAAARLTIAEWGEVFECFTNVCDTAKNIQVKNIVVSGTPSNVSTMKSWHATTDIGILTFYGVSLDYYIDKEIEVFIRDGEILCVKGIVSEEVTYHNAWIITMDNGNIKAYVEGAIREFSYTDRATSYSNVVGDLVLDKKKLVDCNIKTGAVTGKVLSSSEEEIEIENKGTYKLGDNVHYYKTFGTLEMCSAKDVLVGYDVQQFFLEDGKISAVVIDRDINAENIRVLIMNTGYASIYHDEVILSSDTGLNITSGDNTLSVDAGSQYSFTISNEMFKNGRISISSINGGKITINSLSRGYGTPSYRGNIELKIYDGRIVIVNELPVEKYLYAVVPSEMPYTYNIEALKAQAVCARSYAYKQIVNNTYSAYGAHVDDSTNYQVYNNLTEQESSTQAVEETYGRVLTYEEEVINAFFFSTSCGSTTDSHIWGQTLPYTQSKLLIAGDSNMNLKDEGTFDAFIRVSYDTYDSEYPWFRWNVSLSLEDITALVNSSLHDISTSSGENVFVLNDKGEYVRQYVSSVGDVKKIVCLSRGNGGVLDAIEIYGSENTVKITKELNIRRLFNLQGVPIHRVNGSDVTDFPMLPSAYAIFDPIIHNNLLCGYNIIGGGYGHGVGLSQNGANYMGKNGSNFEDILLYFYNNVKITKLY